ncbi:MAG: hypothetical protein ACERKZ_02465 [Lachnotalea sp.]
MELFKLIGKVAIDNNEANKNIDETANKAEKSESKMTSAFKKIGAAVVTYFAVEKILAFGKACIDSASNVQEMENKFNVVFDGMTKEVDSWASSYATAIGRNKNTIKEYLADNQNMFVGMGMTRDAGAELSEKMVQLGLDLASFNNLSEDDAVNALSKAIMGESESAKTLGAVLNDNTRAMAMEVLGYQGKYDALSESEKMEVNYQAILMQSTDAVGDCERSLDSYKGRQIQLQSALENTKEKIGGLLLPLATLGTKFLTTGVNGIQKFIDTMSDAESRSSFFKTAMESMFSQGFIEDMKWFTDTAFPNMLGHLKDTAIQNFGGKLSVLKDLFTKLKTVIQPFVEIYLTQMTNTFLILMDVLNVAVIPVLGFLFDAFTQVVGVILDAIQPALISIADSFTWLYAIINEAISDYILPTIGQFIEMIRKLWTENQDKIQLIGELFSTVFNAIAGTLAWFVGVVQNYIYPLFIWFVNTVQDNMGIIKAIFQSAFDIVGGIIKFFIALFKGDWSGMWEAVMSILSAAFSFIQNVFNLIKAFLASIGSAIWSVVQNAFENIRLAIVNKLNQANASITSIWNAIKTFIASVGSAIGTNISNAFENIRSSIESKLTAAKNLVINIWNSINDSISSKVDGAKNLVSNAFENIRSSIESKLNDAKSTVGNIFSSIKSTIDEKIEGAKSIVSKGVEALKGFFNFSWSLPSLKLPHFKISGEFSLNPPSAPSFGIEWYKNGGVMLEPTAFGINPATGKTMVGGEAGAEAIAPISTLQQYIAEAVTSQNAELISVLNLILQAIYSMDEGLGEKLFNALLNMKFEINNREFARLVKAV